ncbi:MAG TPA: lipid-A-disaccharide synthase [Thermoanaerobaculia bacterium]|nr:lipid-A-disaccharide synthase [Thermoanaerobaculia bacterium]
MKLLVVAGEVSGDQHASALLAALGARVPALEAFGVGGDGCRQEGMRLLAHQKDLAVVGLVEALAKLRFARRLIGSLAAEAVRQRADGAVLIDSPDFNLRLAKRLFRAGIPVVFYVSPQVWAWRSRRAKTIARIGRAVLVLFGFEKRWYDARGLGARVTWVGHPLVDAAARELARPAAPPPPGIRRMVLMPGSRKGEVESILPVLRDAVEILRKKWPDLEVVLVQADSIPRALFEEFVGESLAAWRVVCGDHLALLASSDVLLVASGTATIEGLLARVPMVVVYKIHPVSFWIGKRLVKVAHVAMANIVSDDGTGARTVPELLQGDATPENVAREAARFLQDPALEAATRAKLARGAADLGPPGAAERTADALLHALAEAGPGRGA